MLDRAILIWDAKGADWRRNPTGGGRGEARSRHRHWVYAHGTATTPRLPIRVP